MKIILNIILNSSGHWVISPKAGLTYYLYFTISFTSLKVYQIYFSRKYSNLSLLFSFLTYLTLKYMPQQSPVSHCVSSSFYLFIYSSLDKFIFSKIWKSLVLTRLLNCVLFIITLITNSPGGRNIEFIQ